MMPATETVLKRPLLICPPWINKFYILDLNPQKSFIRWAVEQGHTVFVISWVNPDERHGAKGWEAYIREGLQYGLDTVEKATGEKDVNAIGYCVGGTLLAAALALLAQEGDDRIKSATFFTTQVDFTYAGDLKVFVDEDQIAAVEQLDERKGLSRRHQDGDRLQHAALRRPDLALCRQQLHARQGSPALRPALLERRFDPHGGGQPFLLPAQLLSREQPDARARWSSPAASVSLGDVKIPIYNLASKEDHIAPARSVFLGCAIFRRRGRLCHGRLRPHRRRRQPAGTKKYQYWTGGKPVGDFDDWFATATETSRLLVAALAALDRDPGQHPRCSPQTGQAYENLGRCAGHLCQGACVTDCNVW